MRPVLKGNHGKQRSVGGKVMERACGGDREDYSGGDENKGRSLASEGRRGRRNG